MNWSKTELKVIYKTVKLILERYAVNPNSQPDLLDWRVEFQLFPDYAYSISAFLTYLEDGKKIPDAEFSQTILCLAEDDLNEKAASLGKYVLDSKEYHYLKNIERNWKATQRKMNGWPLSLS